MLFKDRKHAGKLLANLLRKYKNSPEAVVVALPRGGVVLGYEIAKDLNLPLDILCARKINAPNNPEFGIGAITDTGESYLDEEIIQHLNIDPDYIQSKIKEESEEAERRFSTYKKGLPIIPLEKKIVILVDDGIATGATMKASIKAIKTKSVKEIIVAVAVASPQSLEEIKKETQDVICLAAPIFFQAVGQFYEVFNQTSDEEVIKLLHQERYFD